MSQRTESLSLACFMPRLETCRRIIKTETSKTTTATREAGRKEVAVPAEIRRRLPLSWRRRCLVVSLCSALCVRTIRMMSSAAGNRALHRKTTWSSVKSCYGPCSAFTRHWNRKSTWFKPKPAKDASTLRLVRSKIEVGPSLNVSMTTATPQQCHPFVYICQLQ